MPQTAVGLIGLGNMGGAMAQCLARAGHPVIGYDTSTQQCQRAQAQGVEIGGSIAELCQRSQTLLISLPMAKHVQAVLTQADGILAQAQAGSVVVDTSTSEPDITRALATQLAAKDIQLLDCPVSGGPAGAASGSMVMLVGGAAEALERVRPVLEVLSSKIVHLGASGNGHAAKLVNNLLCASHLLSTAEAMALGQRAGLDPQALIEGINAGSGRSAVSEINYPRWVLNEAFDSGFSMGLMRKDVRLAQALIEQLGLDLPMAQQVAERWAESRKTLADELDFNCIVKRLDKE